MHPYLSWSASGQLPRRPDLTPAPGPWPALISDESQSVHPEQAKMHKYPNKHEEKSLENANVRATQISFPSLIYDE